MTIKEIVQGNTAVFQYYKDGALWYAIEYHNKDNHTSGTFLFPVPVDDLKSAILSTPEKAITLMTSVKAIKLMRWICIEFQSREAT